MNWSVKRAYCSRGGWIPCSADSEHADSTVTFTGKQEAIEETVKRNSTENFEIKQEEVVVGFKGNDRNLDCFFVGSSRAETDEGWVLYQGVPVKANVSDINHNFSDCLIVEDKRILSRVTYSTGIEHCWPEYTCFDLTGLPDNVKIIDTLDDPHYDESENDETEISYEQNNIGEAVSSHQEDEDIVQNYEPTFDSAIDHCEVLLKAATPELYRDNAFRVLGLPTTVTAREIERHRKQLKMIAKLGMDSHEQRYGYLPLIPSPDEESIQHAIERLRDPEKRLVDEFFWFWPTKTKPACNEALDLLSANRANEALDILKRNKEHDKSGRTAHNLAVLYHAHALDFEHKYATERFTKEELETCGHWWKGAYQEWRELLDNETFWSQVTARIRELDDPRLTTGIARRIHNSLPKAIFQINSLLAVRAAETNDEATCNYHIQLAKEFGFGKKLFNDIMHEAVTAISDRINIRCESVAHKTKEDPKNANNVARNLLTETRSLLKAIDMLIPKDSLKREHLHDVVAEAGRSCAVVYGKETANLDECLEISREILQVAASKSLRKLIEHDIDTIGKIVESKEQQKKQEEEYKKSVSGNNVYEVTVPGSKVAVPPLCTCCLKGADSKQSVSYSWTEQKTFSKVERSMSLNFPICGECEKHQSELSTKRFLLIILVSGISIALLYFIGLASGTFEYIGYIVAGGIILLISSLVLGSLLRVKALPEEHAARNRAVSMTDVSANYGYATFRFSNYLYALAFAQANNREIKKKDFLKYSRKASLLRGRSAYHVIAWITVLGFIGHSIAYSVLEDSWNDSKSYGTNTYTSPGTSVYRSPGTSYKRSNTSDSGSPPRAYVPVEPDSSLLSEINRGKSKLKVMEAGLQPMQSLLEKYSKRITSLKTEIEQYESDTARGRYVNRSSYDEAVTNHNNLIEQYNSVLKQHQINYAAYETEFKRVTDLIDKYNRGR